MTVTSVIIRYPAASVYWPCVFKGNLSGKAQAHGMLRRAKREKLRSINL